MGPPLGDEEVQVHTLSIQIVRKLRHYVPWPFYFLQFPTIKGTMRCVDKRLGAAVGGCWVRLPRLHNEWRWGHRSQAVAELASDSEPTVAGIARRQAGGDNYDLWALLWHIVAAKGITPRSRWFNPMRTRTRGILQNTIHDP